ncbi:MAG: hypothetical protein HYV07_19330 [Deltaproteobacteria bacterium]|nr:hypothetical protein [Deltaproteobacteria bacterium]
MSLAATPILCLLVGAPGEGTPPAPPDPEPSKHRISLQGGLGTPVGLVGAAWAFELARPLRLELGAGLGYSGVQVSLMPKLSFGSLTDRFVAGAGLAWIAYPTYDCSAPCAWINLDLAGYEHLFPGGNTLFVSGGITIPMHDGGQGWFRYHAWTIFPQLTLGFGSWLGGASPEEIERAELQARTGESSKLPAARSSTASTSLRAHGAQPLERADGASDEAAATSTQVRRVRIAFQVGGGSYSPWGIFSLGLAYSFADWFRLEASIGHHSPGWRAAVAPAVALGASGHHVVVTPSAGYMNQGFSACDVDCVVLGGDVGYEYISEGGFSVFLAGGASTPIRPRPDLQPFTTTSVHGRLGFAWWISSERPWPQPPP